MNRQFVQTITLGLFFLSISAIGYAQSSENTDSQEDCWVFGGDFGIGFSTNSSNITLSPQLAYKITPKWEFGTRLTYTYYRFNDLGTKVSTNNYGGGFYTIYDIYYGFFAQAENEMLSYEKVFWNQSGTNRLEYQRVWVHSIFVGGGFRQFMSDRAFVSVTLLYNLNETLNSPYANPLIRIGFGVAL